MNPVMVSAVVVMRNEREHIEKCIRSILECELPQEQFEILVVDGMSEDGSREIVTDMMTRASNVRLLNNTARITPAGLNRGIRNARGRYIVIMGAHCEYPNNYLDTCVAELERTGADVVGGTLVTRPGAASTVAHAIALATTHRFGVGNSGFRLGQGGRYADTVPFGAYRREVFDRVGLFREELVRHQDFELNSRVRAAGGQLYLTDKLQVTYYNVPTFSRFLKQAYLKGIWIGRGWIWSPACFCPRHAVPAAFVTGLAALGLAAFSLPLAGRIDLSLLCVYIIVAVLCGLEVALRNGWKFLVLLPPLFAFYHVGYGIGTVVGLALAVAAKRPGPVPILVPDRIEPTRDLTLVRAMRTGAPGDDHVKAA